MPPLLPLLGPLVNIPPGDADAALSRSFRSTSLSKWAKVASISAFISVKVVVVEMAAADAEAAGTAVVGDAFTDLGGLAGADMIRMSTNDRREGEGGERGGKKTQRYDSPFYSTKELKKEGCN